MTGLLGPADFPAFFRGLWGVEPFPWQVRLVEEAWNAGRFPSLLDLPTGVGKTSVLEMAVFLMALGAGEPTGSNRRFPRRALVVVDRRVVVDQAAERARTLAEKLASPTDPLLQRVAECLRQLAGLGSEDDGDVPLAWVQLRGGMARDESWAHHPAQPLVGASTVDQVGSRLLFRGYGISDGAKPIHAGLLGKDTVLFLDEVHLSEPFRKTLQTIMELRSRAQEPLTTGWQVVEMSATPGERPSEAYGISDADREHPVLGKRLHASKPIQVKRVTVKGGEAKRREALAKEAVDQVHRLFQEHEHVRTLALVVNRVDTARYAARLLEKKSTECILLTGRSRPLDRDRILAKYGGRIRSGRFRDPQATPFVVVATQCIEAGADFDFDALVTECASLDALRQRFGRLDRLGSFHTQKLAAPGVILVREDQLQEEASDPVYGYSLKATFLWCESLASQKKLDFGIERLEKTDAPGLLAPRPRAPELLGGHLDLWSQTRPRPHADPDVSLWLHGIRENTADVLILWRQDLDALREAQAGEESWLDAVAALPPSPLEAVSLPLWAAREWLAGGKPPGPADVEGISEGAQDTRGDAHQDLRFVLWRGDDSVVSQDPGVIRPGDTVVLPASIGGLDRQGNWDPAASNPVTDLAELAHLVQRGRPVLRLLPTLWPELPEPPRPGGTLEDGEEYSESVLVDAYLRTLRNWMAAHFPPETTQDGDNWRVLVLRKFLDQSAHRRPRRIQVAGEAHGGFWVLTAPRLPLGKRRVAAGREVGSGLDEFSSAEDSASFTASEIPLNEHLRGVGHLARRFAVACGLPRPLCEAVALAAELHDLGKADPRFQAMLCGGDRALAAALLAEGVPLAKSAIAASDRRRRHFARKQAGWPAGGRHELLSVEMARPLVREKLAKRLKDADEEELNHLETLVLHLIASHHGWCRPFPPPVWDDYERNLSLQLAEERYEIHISPQRYRMDSGAADRFWAATRRYGWWGLAWLEAIIRLADHRRSEWEVSNNTALNREGSRLGKTEVGVNR